MSSTNMQTSIPEDIKTAVVHVDYMKMSPLKCMTISSYAVIIISRFYAVHQAEPPWLSDAMLRCCR